MPCARAQLEEAAQQQQVAILVKNIDDFWRKRIQGGDPFQKLLHQDKVRTLGAIKLPRWTSVQLYISF